MNNVAPVPTSSEMRNIMTSHSRKLVAGVVESRVRVLVLLKTLCIQGQVKYVEAESPHIGVEVWRIECRLRLRPCHLIAAQNYQVHHQ
ncbi:hypothetical protein TNCV_4631 [Trichonephila clavipes]|nr:hypothetical protein TNCV_4631 [Trichonephila clavipes]